MAGTKAPVVFIHGLWLHATSWQPWQELFAEAGYQPSAPGWPGDADTVEATRANPDNVANKGIDEVTDHYAKIIDALPAPPILIGHSFGGLIAEKLLGMDRGAAATTGPANLAASAVCRDETEFYEFMTTKIGSLPGVERMETAPIIRTVKQASPTTSPGGATGLTR